MMAWRYRVRLILGYLSLVASVLATTAAPRILHKAVDAILAGADHHTMMWLALALVSAALLRGLFDFGRSFFSDSLSQKVTYY